MAQRSMVDQVVGDVKTEATKRPVPIEPFMAENLVAWYRTLGTADQRTASSRPTRRGAARNLSSSRLVVEGDAVPYPTRGHATSVSPSAWAGTRSGAPTRLCYRRMAKT